MIGTPYDASAGAISDPAIGEALALADNYTWLCRLTAEMDAEAQTDVKRALQIVQHAGMFKGYVGRMQQRFAGEGVSSDGDFPMREVGDIQRTLEGVFLLKKVRLEKPSTILDELVVASQKYSALADYLQANVATPGAEYTVAKIIGYSHDGAPTVTDDAIKVGKPADLTPLLQDAAIVSEAQAAPAVP